MYALTAGISEHPELNALLEKASSDCLLRGEPLCATPLFGDGSDRKFFRVRQGRKSFVALVSERRKDHGVDENDSYHHIGIHLRRRGVPVPRFYVVDPANGCFLMEDVGDFHLQKLAARSRGSLEKVYRHVLRLMIATHRRGSQGFDSAFCFDTPVYDAVFAYTRELEYFREAFLIGYLGLEVAAEDLRRDFEMIIGDAEIDSAAKTIVHRDFQSRNIMVHRGVLRLLDFQGMRFGPSEYDLASVLIDPYVRLHRTTQDGFVDLYWSAAKDYLGISYRKFLARYAALRICRNLQVLGAFGYLGIVKGKRQFLSYIPRAWISLREWLAGPCKGRYHTLQKQVETASFLKSRLLCQSCRKSSYC